MRSRSLIRTAMLLICSPPRSRSATNMAPWVLLKPDLINRGSLAIPVKEAIQKELSCAGEILDHLSCLHHSNESGCHPDHRKDLDRGRVGEGACQACSLPREYGCRLSAETPDPAMKEGDLLCICCFIQ